MPQSDTERPVLILQGDKQTSDQWVLNKDNTILGRDESCDIMLSERQVSRQHIRIFKEGSQFYIEDLDSKNGTWVNGVPIKGVRELHHNDEIQVALTTRLQFIGSNATAPMPMPVPGYLGGRLRIDRDARRVFIHDEELDPPLSLPQYRLLELLYNNAGSICTRDAVVEAVWPEAMGEGVSEQAIDALVRRLRDRLAEADPEFQYIVTVRGHGFRLDNHSD
jgi:hypothetical protein